MTAHVFAKPLGAELWQWYSAGANDDAPAQGDFDALLDALPSGNPRVTLLLPGQQFVSAAVELDAKQRKHAAKLVPFELEDELCSSVDQTHFSFSPASDDSVAVVYGNKARCEEPIKQLDESGCDVRVALPDYLLLPWQDAQLSLFFDGEVLIARSGEHKGFAIEADLAQTWLLRSQGDFEGCDRIRLIATTEEALEQLKSWVPADLDELEQDTLISNFWHLLPMEPAPSSLNLRRGSLSRQLPFKSWWLLWRFPVYVFAFAFVVSIVINLLAYQGYKSEQLTVRDAMNAVYLDAVPNGRLGDVERLLESKLKGTAVSASEPSNMVFLLSKLSEAVAKYESAKISSLNYNGEQRSLQVTIDVDALSTLSTLREQMKGLGLDSESPRTSAQNDGYQARMTVREVTQ